MFLFVGVSVSVSINMLRRYTQNNRKITFKITENKLVVGRSGSCQVHPTTRVRCDKKQSVTNGEKAWKSKRSGRDRGKIILTTENENKI